MKKNKLYFIILLLIFILGMTFRLYKIRQSPPGLYVDEAAIGYNAYSILQTGKDEYGKAFPIYFRSFGDYKMPLYIYLSVIPIKLLGLNVFSIRFISFLSGSLTIILVYFLSRLLFSKMGKGFSLLVSFLFAITPLPIFFSRMALEPSLALFLLLLGLYFQIYFFKKNGFGLLILSVLFYALSSYTYHTEKYISPVLMISVSTIYYFRFRFEWKNSLQKQIIAILLFFVLFLPQIILYNSSAGQARVNSLSNKNHSIINFLSSYSAYFSPRNLFFNPDSDRQRSLPEQSVFYSWMVIPFLLGVFNLIGEERKEISEKVIILLALISPIPASFAIDPFSSFRSYPFVFPFIIIISLGIFKIFNSFKDKILFWGLGGVIVLVSLVGLWRNNLFLLPNERFLNWSYGYSELSKKLEPYMGQNILINDPIGTSYVELLFFQKYSPQKLQTERSIDLNNYYNIKGWNSTSSWGNFIIKSLDFQKDVFIKQLIVADPSAVSEGQAKEHYFTKVFDIIGPDGKIVFNAYLTNPDLKKLDNEKKLTGKQL